MSSNLVSKRCRTLDPTFLTYRLLPNTQELPESAPICTRTQYLVHYLHKHWVLASTSSLSEGDNAPKCSGAESSNANFSFPEHFEGKRQSGEMYQKDCLPLLSTFCKFQRLKVKGSRVMLVCLHQHSPTREWSDVADATCAGCSHSEIQLFCGSHFMHLCVVAQVHPW